MRIMGEMYHGPPYARADRMTVHYANDRREKITHLIGSAMMATISVIMIVAAVLSARACSV
jgi:hypothetical protein